MIEVYGSVVCPKCERAKKILDGRNIDYKYHCIGLDVTAEYVKDLFPKARALPIIVDENGSQVRYEDLETYEFTEQRE